MFDGFTDSTPGGGGDAVGDDFLNRNRNQRLILARPGPAERGLKPGFRHSPPDPTHSL